jgi:hypothetical protein
MKLVLECVDPSTLIEECEEDDDKTCDTYVGIAFCNKARSSSSAVEEFITPSMKGMCTVI